jgi:hypothetical protein
MASGLLYFIVVRTAPRTRHYVSPGTLTLCRPVLAFDYAREAYILRGIGGRLGPVLREDRRRGSSQKARYKGPERRGGAVRMSGGRRVSSGRGSSGGTPVASGTNVPPAAKVSRGGAKVSAAPRSARRRTKSARG